MGKPTYLDLLRCKNYRTLLSANFINRLGDAIDTLAFTWIVYSFTGEGTWAAILFAVNKIPSVALLPFAGAMVEKLKKKNTMMVCDVIRCVLVLALILVMGAGRLSVPALAAFTFLISVAEAFRIPASTSFLTQLLNREMLDRGVMLNVVITTLVEIGGAAAGGLLISGFGAQAALAADVLSFVLSILLIASIRQEENISTDMKEASSIQVLKDGLIYIRKNVMLLFVIATVVLANGVMSPIDSLLAVVVVDVFHREAGYLSVLKVVLSVGMLLGGISYPALRARIKDEKWYLGAFVYIGLLYFYVAGCGSWLGTFGGSHVVMAGLYFLYGIAASFLAAGLGIQLMENVQQEYMARVSTVYSAIASAAVPAASALAGLFLKKFALTSVFFGAAFVILGLAVVWEVLRGIYVKAPRIEAADS